jgi:hypothetical protein
MRCHAPQSSRLGRQSSLGTLVGPRAQRSVRRLLNLGRAQRYRTVVPQCYNENNGQNTTSPSVITQVSGEARESSCLATWLRAGSKSTLFHAGPFHRGVCERGFRQSGRQPEDRWRWCQGHQRDRPADGCVFPSAAWRPPQRRVAKSLRCRPPSSVCMPGSEPAAALRHRHRRQASQASAASGRASTEKTHPRSTPTLRAAPQPSAPQKATTSSPAATSGPLTAT